jgi:hypothetical protein
VDFPVTISLISYVYFTTRAKSNFVTENDTFRAEAVCFFIEIHEPVLHFR